MGNLGPISIPITKEKDMDELSELVDSIRAVAKAEKNEEIVGRIMALEAKIAELTPQAAEGIAYRDHLVTEALAQGVRAQGKEFDAAAYEAILRAAPLGTIERMRDDWKRIADKTFPVGRQSVDSEQEQSKPRLVTTPDAAFLS
jgi:hypothetical protein